MEHPLVSICVPTRNRANSLRESLKSICAQDYSPLEILISDNCSDDDTEQVCREASANDSRIRYVHQPRNIGLHGNHNFCMDASRGEYLCIFHDHDVRDSAIVSTYVSFLADHPTAGVVCSDWDLIGDDGRRLGVRDHDVKTITRGLDYVSQTIRSGRSSIGIPGAMVRRAALGDTRFVLDAPIGFGDFPIWFRVAENWDVGHIHRRLWSWRQNAESHSARTIESISRDYDQNLSGYCDDHLTRWPDHQGVVQDWRARIRHYLFWALAYEIGIHFRTDTARRPEHARTLFEIMDYRLTPGQFEHALELMRGYRTDARDYLTFAALSAMIRLRLTSPLGWVTRYQATLRSVLGLK